MEKIYWVLFFIGVVYTGITFVLGGLIGLVDDIGNGFHGDTGNGFHGDTGSFHGDTGGGFHGDVGDMGGGFHGDIGDMGGGFHGDIGDMGGGFHGDAGDIGGGFHGDIGDMGGGFHGDAGDMGGGLHGDAGSFHGGMDGHAHSDLHSSSHVGSKFTLPIKPFQIVIFLTTFGGVGVILIKMNIIWWITIAPAFFTAMVLVVVLDKFIYMPLVRAQTTVKKQSYAIGLTATVLEKIPENGFGRISYIVSGNILSSVAKAKQGGASIPKGANVVINTIDKNIFYVTEVRELDISKK